MTRLPRTPVVSEKLSLKFCYKFAEIRSLKLHA